MIRILVGSLSIFIVLAHSSGDRHIPVRGTVAGTGGPQQPRCDADFLDLLGFVPCLPNGPVPRPTRRSPSAWFRLISVAYVISFVPRVRSSQVFLSASLLTTQGAVKGWHDPPRTRPSGLVLHAAPRRAFLFCQKAKATGRRIQRACASGRCACLGRNPTRPEWSSASSGAAFNRILPLLSPAARILQGNTRLFLCSLSPRPGSPPSLLPGPDGFVALAAAGMATRPGRLLPGRNLHPLAQRTYTRHTWTATPGASLSPFLKRISQLN